MNAPIPSIFLIVILFALFLLAAQRAVIAFDRWLDRFNQVRQAEEAEKLDDRD